MKLLYAPGACSIGIHVILEEIGAPFEIERVSLRDGEHLRSSFTSINPKSKVPTLIRDDGSVLTEFPAIAYYLANTHPAAKLWPEGVEAQSRALEIIDYIVATIHMQGFSRMFAPGKFAPSAADAEAVKKRGLEIFETGLTLLDQTLAGKDYAVGPFSVADAALFYIEFWRHSGKMELPANLALHYQRMLARPAVRRVLEKEGLA
jgi:glutathione S-transferase